MTLEALLDTVPDYAKDLKLNLSNVLRQAELTPQQTWGAALACAIACRNPELLAAIAQEARQHLTPAAFQAAGAAAAVMGRTNVYYRFLHLVENEKYRTIPARLRMNVIRTHGSDPVDFELWCTAVSAINNCQACAQSHERVVREKGLPEETILAAVRIAAVIHGLAAVLQANAALAGQTALVGA
jgi:alkyl hydroperoxide reductase subunit D